MPLPDDRPRSSRVAAGVLFAFAAALPVHTFPALSILPRAGLGEWLFAVPLALALVDVRSLWRDRAMLAPLLVLTIGLAPAVVFAIDRPLAARQWLVFAYTGLLFFASARLARAGYFAPLARGFGAGVALQCVLGVVGMGLAFAGHETRLAVATGEYGRLVMGAEGLPRPYALMETPNMLAPAIAAALVITAPKSAVVRAAGLVALALCWGHPMLACLGALCLHRAREEKGAAASLLRAAAVASLAGLAFMTAFRVLPLSGRAPFFDAHASPYAFHHRSALHAFLDHPWVGVGLECFNRVSPSYSDPSLRARVFEGIPMIDLGPKDPHSTYLGFAAEAGLFGIAVLFVLAVLALRARHRAGAAFFTVVLLAFFCGYVLDVLTSRELFFSLGLLYGHARRSPRG